MTTYDRGADRHATRSPARDAARRVADGLEALLSTFVAYGVAGVGILVAAAVLLYLTTVVPAGLAALVAAWVGVVGLLALLPFAVVRAVVWRLESA